MSKEKKSRNERTAQAVKKSLMLPQAEALALLTANHSYSNPRSVEYRRELAAGVIRGNSTGMGLVDQVRSSIYSLRSIPGTDTQEIADLIKAFALVYKNQVQSVLQGVRSALTRHDDLADGLIIGAFEAATTIGVEMRGATDGITFLLGYALRGEYLTGLECQLHPCNMGRLSKGLCSFFGRSLWLEGEFQRYRLLQVAPFADFVCSEKTGALDKIDRLHDHLINEITGKLFWSAPPAYRLLILQKGLVEAVKQHEAFLEQRVAA